MDKYIAIAVSLVVIGFAFFGNPLLKSSDEDNTQGFKLSFPTLTHDGNEPIRLELPGIQNNSAESVGNEAFAAFAQYREHAKNNNIVGVESLSHQISPACSDASRREECNALMNSVYFFTQNFKQEEFKHIAYDNKQIVMYTDFERELDEGGGSEPVRKVLFFTRQSDGPKILGIKFCLPEEEGASECFELNPSRRDMNTNGWWDSVEAFFK